MAPLNQGMPPHEIILHLFLIHHPLSIRPARDTESSQPCDETARHTPAVPADSRA